MLHTRRIPIIELNEYLTCKLCKGYFIDATTIIECLHTFCRSCIVKYLEKNKYCPVCDVQVHKTKPLLNVRPDKTLQDIVYKLVPRLFQNEMCRRREFYMAHPEARPSNLEQCGEASYQHILSPDETICLSLNYHGHTGPPRYLRCPAAVSVVHIQKLLRAKYDLCDNHRVDILHNQDCLNSHLTLMDIAYIYLWRRKGPLELTYRIYESTAKRIKLESNATVTPSEEAQANDQSSECKNESLKNEWKEVQLQISESGEMCVTGVDNSTVLNEEITKGSTTIEIKAEIPTVTEAVLPKSPSLTPKKEVPPLKLIEKTSSITTLVVSTSSIITTNSCAKTVFSIPRDCDVNSTESVCLNKGRSELCVPSSSSNTLSTFTPSSTSSSSNFSFTPYTSTSTFSGAGVTRNSTSCTYSTLTSVSSCATSHNGSNSISNNKTGLCLATTNVETPSACLMSKVDEPMSFKTIATIAGDPTNCTGIVTTAVTTVTVCSNSVTSVSNSGAEVHSSLSITESHQDKQVKRKSIEEGEGEPPSKQPKQTILNHSLGLHGLSNNHPLRRHAQMTRGLDTGTTSVTSNKIPSNSMLPVFSNCSTSNITASSTSGTVKTSIITVSTGSVIKTTCSSISMPCTTTSAMTGKPIIINKSYASSQQNRPTSPVKKWSSKSGSVSVPCYSPKTTYNSVLNVPRVSTSITKSEYKSVSQSSSTLVSTTVPTTVVNNKLPIKSKPSTPIGYKTLRDPPKTWNPQISRASLQKSTVESKYADLKNIRPAKFFKMRNNMPRYLGNPASGVKPMYQVHCSPEKEKAVETNSKPDKMEIKKHSIVKIDPKTLKPISEKAPETTSLSNQTDLKINTSSVSIFNPLKLQSSPKNERKSPKSPHSPPKLKTSSPPSKRDKLNLNFTPPNPFIPNLASPTLNPNQFLYSTGPPGFPTYDPRVMAAYHSLLYGQRLPFPPSPLPRLNLDLNQRKSFESPASPKMPVVSSISSEHNSKTSGTLHISPKSSGISQTSPRVPETSASLTRVGTINATTGSTNTNFNQQGTKSPNLSVSTGQNLAQTNLKGTQGSLKKVNGKEGIKSEKSLENTVEKLTQNKTKEIMKDTITDIKKNNNQISNESQNFSCNNEVSETTAKEEKTDVKEQDSKPKDIPTKHFPERNKENKEMVNGKLTLNGSLEVRNDPSEEDSKSSEKLEEGRDTNGNLPIKKSIDNGSCDENLCESAKDKKSGLDEKVNKSNSDEKMLQKRSENKDLTNSNKNLLVQTDPTI